MKLTIAIAPNEDGLGTSAWTVRLVKELLRQAAGKIARIQVLVASESLARFHADKYPATPVEVVRLEGVSHPVRLVKASGGVNVSATIEAAVLTYSASRRAYQEALAARGVLEGADLVIDLGVPQVVRAVWEENRRRAAAGRRPIAGVTLCDHAWSRSLREMAAGQGLLTERAAGALARMQGDEALTPEALLFPEPLTPAEYEVHWRNELGVPVRRIPGVLGGPLWAEEWAGAEPRAAVRSLLEIEDELPVLHVSGGGTSVWDDVLAGLLDEYVRIPPRYHVAVFSPPEAGRRGVVMRVREGRSCALESGRHPACSRLIFLGRAPGETHHVLFAGFDMALTRAGGGALNDAIAFRVPLALVEEPGHWQVERIREVCWRMGLCRTATLEEFRRRGRNFIERPEGELIGGREARAALDGIPNHAEVWLAGHLLERAQGRG